VRVTTTSGEARTVIRPMGDDDGVSVTSTRLPQRPSHDGASRGITRADVMRAQDVAELVGIPMSTVYQYAREHRLPCRRRGRHLLFLRWEVETWLSSPDCD
jgi:excisionase family DNA binding protein